MNKTIQEHYVGPVVYTKENERTNRPPVGHKLRWDRQPVGWPVGPVGRWSFYIHRRYCGHFSVRPSVRPSVCLSVCSERTVHKQRTFQNHLADRPINMVENRNFLDVSIVPNNPWGAHIFALFFHNL